jgi:hypothetical protein
MYGIDRYFRRLCIKMDTRCRPRFVPAHTLDLIEWMNAVATGNASYGVYAADALHANRAFTPFGLSPRRGPLLSTPTIPE